MYAKRNYKTHIVQETLLQYTNLHTILNNIYVTQDIHMLHTYMYVLQEASNSLLAGTLHIHLFLYKHTYTQLIVAYLRGHLTEMTVMCSICWPTRKLFIHTVFHLSCLTTVLFEQFPQPVNNVAVEHTVWEAQ